MKGGWSLGVEEDLGLTPWREQDLYCGVESWVQGDELWGSAHGGIWVLSFMVE